MHFVECFRGRIARSSRKRERIKMEIFPMADQGRTDIKTDYEKKRRIMKGLSQQAKEERGSLT